jgi:hypothetical protein
MFINKQVPVGERNGVMGGGGYECVFLYLIYFPFAQKNQYGGTHIVVLLNQYLAYLTV